MIDERDNKTGELLPKPRSPGRPPTGVKAATAAQRKQKQRERDKDARTLEQVTTVGLIELLSRTMADCKAMHDARKQAIKEKRVPPDNTKRLARAVGDIENISAQLVVRAREGVGHE